MGARGIGAGAVLLALAVSVATASGSEDGVPAGGDSGRFDADGTAHITRVVPVPSMISPEAQQWLASLPGNQPGDEDLATRRSRTDAWRARDSAEAMKHYPVTIKAETLAGVAVDVISPLQLPAANRHRVFINLHGGGFNSDSGSRIEGDPIANLARTRVVSVYYRLAPEHPFPAAVDDVVAVYRELLKSYQAKAIGMYGTSAGATLTAEVTARLGRLGLPLPGALGFFSGTADYSRVSDSRQLFGNDGLPGVQHPIDFKRPGEDTYVGSTNRTDPLLSPLYADLHGWPPTLLVSATRDALLGDTTTFHRALLHAAVDARLVVFEALPHAFWYHFDFPETNEALALMAQFLDAQVRH
ncbi:MAG TPA: alpha/beta hydrolase fold domain-containing protein [Steroidobacteraceae bacterium]|jgi:acetyl esterase/lipase